MDARSSTQFNAVQCITQNFPFGISEHIAPLPLPTPWDRESCWRFVCQPCRARSCSKVLCTPLTKLESTLLITATHTISTRQRDYLRPIPPCPLFFFNTVAINLWLRVGVEDFGSYTKLFSERWISFSLIVICSATFIFVLNAGNKKARRCL